MTADSPDEAIVLRAAEPADFPAVLAFLEPFVSQQQILPRTDQELAKLLKNGFVAHGQGQLIGFAAVEIYSWKMAEIQCLAVSADWRGRGIGRRLIRRCVNRAAELNIYELMAITASEKPFTDCGFDYSLPGQKRALFVHPTKEQDSSEK